ncbi:hypothetical protein llap_17649 [Limosa lapponica baueri]|uniref:MYCBP-associated protein n=1 Tax=Limosa lapponica baueri TaxID=1758121 RepID=A0A2I0TE50_LIMLA|nr:hypothetical protein llap_17649 [Limosa lapponica baueri]
MLFSTYREQVRPEVWFSQSLPLYGEGLPSEKLHQQVLKSRVQEEVMEGRITEASSSKRTSVDGVRLAKEELVLWQCHCSSLISQIIPSIVCERVPSALVLFLSELSEHPTLLVLVAVGAAVEVIWGKDSGFEILQRPENELLMNTSEDYRQIQEERDLIDRCLPPLLPGKGYRRGSEFWRQPERIGDEVTGITMTLTQRERGYPEPVTHVGKPHSVQMETGLKPPKRIPFHLTWHKSLFLKERRQDLKFILEELDFYKPDLDGLEVIGKGQPFTSASTEPFACSIPSDKSETLDSLSDYPSVAPEGVEGPSLDFCGQPARWINGTTSRRDEVGIAARLTFETLVGEKAESSLTVSNDGTTAIWYDWLRLPQKIPSRETKRIRTPYFYFDTRSGVMLPGETRKFSFIFKSESAGIFSESWEFRTHPLLLGGALLQVTLWGIAVSKDIFADLREKLETDLAAREGVAIVEEYLKKHLVKQPCVRTPERSPSPVDVTEEELFHWKNPEEQPSSRKLKDVTKTKSSTSLLEVKEGAQPLEVLTADQVEPPQVQVDPVLFWTYQEKLYVEVYGLLDSMVSKMVSLFEDLEREDALKWESKALCD